MENVTPKVNSLSVSKLNKYIKKMLEDDYVLRDIFVSGEISNLKKHTSGHYYFTLKDEKCQISCVIFKGYAASIDFNIENGMSVVCYGYVSMYEVTGQFQLYVEMVNEVGIGTLSKKYEELKNKLLKKGYFDEKYKKEIPLFPRTVAVLTSDTGAAVRDIIKTIKRRNRLIRIIIVPTIVQGINSKESIVQNIEDVNRLDYVDVIILGRGGGSIEDLWSFNEEDVCTAIFKSKIPIISSVGHESDFTLSDFVADYRASTPTAAAEIVSPELSGFIEKIETLTNRLTFTSLKNLSRKKDTFYNLINRNVLKRPELLVINEQKRIFSLIKELDSKIELKLIVSKNRLSSQTIVLENNSPIKILNSGYTLVYKDEMHIKNKSQLKKNDEVTVKFQDGDISMIVR